MNKYFCRSDDTYGKKIRARYIENYIKEKKAIINSRKNKKLNKK